MGANELIGEMICHGDFQLAFLFLLKKGNKTKGVNEPIMFPTYIK